VKTDFTDSLRNKIVETISSSQGIIRPAALDYFDKIVAGKLPFDYTYWRIILFGEWLKLFEVKIS
jgi:asparagine synthase (glutamine-hydrolysing)